MKRMKTGSTLTKNENIGSDITDSENNGSKKTQWKMYGSEFIEELNNQERITGQGTKLLGEK